MKNLLFLILICGFTVAYTAVNAQLRKIPAKVTNNFKNRYPEASNVVWRDIITSVQADFVMDGERYKADFNRRGKWEKTIISETGNELPLVIKDGWQKSKYKSWKIRSVQIVYYANGKKHFYVIAAKNDVRKKGLVFNRRGQLLSDNMTI